MNVKVAQSCLTLCDPMDYTVHGILQGIFPIKESNWGLLHCWQILYQLSYSDVYMLIPVSHFIPPPSLLASIGLFPASVFSSYKDTCQWI